MLVHDYAMIFHRIFGTYIDQPKAGHAGMTIGIDSFRKEEDLRLDIPDGPLGALTPRDDYHIIKPGEPEESELWFRVS